MSPRQKTAPNYLEFLKAVFISFFYRFANLIFCELFLRVIFLYQYKKKEKNS